VGTKKRGYTHTYFRVFTGERWYFQQQNRKEKNMPKSITESVGNLLSIKELVSREAKDTSYYLLRKEDMRLGTETYRADDKDQERLVMIVPDADNGQRVFNVTQNALGQLANRARVPLGYAQILGGENNGLLGDCLMQGLRSKNPVAKEEDGESGNDNRLLLKTSGHSNLDAVLSETYRVISNDDVVAVAELLMKQYDLEPGRCYKGADGSLVIHLLSKEHSLKIGQTRDNSGAKVDDIIRFGVKLSNNENGGGSFRINFYTIRLICLNGMVSPRTRSTLRIVNNGKVSYDVPLAASSIHYLEKGKVKRYDTEKLVDRSMECVGKLLVESEIQELQKSIDNARGVHVEIRNPDKISRNIARTADMTGISDGSFAMISGEITKDMSMTRRINLWDITNCFTFAAQRTPLRERVTIENNAQKILGFTDSTVRFIEQASYGSDGDDSTGNLLNQGGGAEEVVI
jgi:hypothetical protein